MSEIEKMKRYIERTNLKPNAKDKYGMGYIDLIALKSQVPENVIDTLLLAFDYGRAKGYRAGKKEARK